MPLPDAEDHQCNQIGMGRQIVTSVKLVRQRLPIVA